MGKISKDLKIILGEQNIAQNVRILGNILFRYTVVFPNKRAEWYEQMQVTDD